MLCRATTKSGARCTRQADDSGFCAQHDRRTPAEKEKVAKEKEQQRAMLHEVVEIAQHACEVTGWGFQVDSLDDKTWRYATVTAWRRASNGEEVMGQFNIAVQDGVRISVTKTSFHGYGLEDLHRSMARELERLPWIVPAKKKNPEPRLDTILKLINRFDVVANELKRRYENRETLRVGDEYDVQDLLRALLKLHFDDVRPEEYVPSKAGAGSRLDFLLKSEKIGLEKDLSRKTERLEVIVVVVPK